MVMAFIVGPRADPWNGGCHGPARTQPVVHHRPQRRGVRVPRRGPDGRHARARAM